MTHPVLPQVSDANPRLQLIEDRLGEPLADLVRARRADRVGWGRIAAELMQRTDVYVTGEALRLWATRAERVA